MDWANLGRPCQSVCFYGAIEMASLFVHVLKRCIPLLMCNDRSSRWECSLQMHF
jgi:hypothetical protein